MLPPLTQVSLTSYLSLHTEGKAGGTGRLAGYDTIVADVVVIESSGCSVHPQNTFTARAPLLPAKH